jgi:hypothetical protein
VKTLYLAKNHIEGILQPRYLSFLDNLRVIDLQKNSFLEKLESKCDPIIFILFLISGELISKINNRKISSEDRV